jgi:transcriptional regulator with XRE-family HTH domain
MDIRKRREALGWTRRDLGERAHIAASVIQLIELGHSLDEMSKRRLEAVLDAAEQGLPMPTFGRDNGTPESDA